MGKFDKEYNEMMNKEMAMLKEHFENRLQHLDRELEIRLSLGVDSFKKIEPTFAYENEPAMLAHLMKGIKISVEEEKIKLKRQLIDIERNELKRKEQEYYADEAAKNAARNHK